MVDRVLFVLVCLATLGSAVVGGIFYGFSSFVMMALGRIEPMQAVAVMNSMNLTVINASFMGAFVGTALLCVPLAAGSCAWWGEPSGKLVLIAALSYIAGAFGLTMVLHQPMNLKLADLPPAQAASYWPQYLQTWTQWNHVRTAASLLSAAAFVAALRVKQ